MAAQRDLDEIWEHIASELQNTSAAKRTVDRIMDDVDQLESFAEIGTLLSSVADIQSDYRFLVTGSYLSFYRIHGSEIYVDRVLYPPHGEKTPTDESRSGMNRLMGL